MIQDEQVLVTLDIQRFYMQYMFGITYKVTIIYFIRSEQTTRKKYLLRFFKKKSQQQTFHKYIQGVNL